ncbi:hypothetical protein [Psychromonas ossibalaenae]|uniref:hypothetical protein n=1 Tax=Psychromonas ossibalaenae TaxID=444922 RepID=UPI0003811C6C|nr:hypothetical protein [Psychromonas ossibalaenae]
MSQHLITQFINRTYTFKPLNDAKIANHKLKKYQASNRKNNVSPEDIEESTHILQKIKVRAKQTNNEKDEVESHIDVTV